VRTLDTLWAPIACVAIALAAPAAQAESRALLVGVGEYTDASANLPGIRLDLDIMREVAEILGFSKGQVRTLLDAQVTAASVEKAIEEWLVRDVGPQDRVLLYYSGHGTQIPDENGDEPDGADEVVTMHDLRATRRNGKATLDGVLVDDDLARLLAKIPSRKVLVLIDACHSGTITKSIDLDPRYLGIEEGVVKFYAYPGMPEAGGADKADLAARSFTVEERATPPGVFVAISAARDDQKSIATERGSVFTLGVREGIRTASQRGEALTPRKLTTTVDGFVAANTKPERRFNPQLTGDGALADDPLTVARLSNGRGPVRGKMEEILRRSAKLEVRAPTTSLAVGEEIVFEVQVPKAGYLNVVDVGPDDRPTVLFPNKDHPSNRVEAGVIRVGSAQMPFLIRAQAPAGPSLVAAILTDQPVDLRASGMGARDSKGDLEDLFGEVSAYGLKDLEDRSLGVESRKPGATSGGGAPVTAGAVEITVRDR
jgi:hypothetical protein